MCGRRRVCYFPSDGEHAVNEEQQREFLRQLAQAEAAELAKPQDEETAQRLALITQLREKVTGEIVFVRGAPRTVEGGSTFEERQERRLAELDEMERRAQAAVAAGLAGGWAETLRTIENLRMDVRMMREPEVDQPDP